MANPNSIVIIVLESPKKNQFDQFPERGRTFEVLRSLHLLDSSFNILVPNWMALKWKPDRLICFNLCVCKSIVFLIVLIALLSFLIVLFFSSSCTRYSFWPLAREAPFWNVLPPYGHCQRVRKKCPYWGSTFQKGSSLSVSNFNNKFSNRTLIMSETCKFPEWGAKCVVEGSFTNFLYLIIFRGRAFKFW